MAPRRHEAARWTLALASLAVATASLAAHDLFFRPFAFHVSAQATVLVPVLNGTFSSSENAVTRDRLADLSLVGPFGRRSVDANAWSEKDPRSDVRFETGAPGTYVLGAAVKPKVLELPGKEFNAYLKDEGIDSILAKRKEQGRLQEPSKERYAKFPKTLIQVGDARSGDFASVLGYEAEIVPLDNPYSLKPGDTLRVRCLLLGTPLPNYVVFAGGRRVASEKRLDSQRLMTDADGVVAVKVTAEGDYFVKFVHMREVDGPEANYESRWATLTFGIGR
jgi:uncharacterized GH25 family protein